MDVDVATPAASDPEQNVLDTVEGEIYFFRSLMRSRPVGLHRHFHVLSMQHAIEKGTGHSVSVNDIWNKLASCYNLDALEALDAEYESSGSNASTPQAIPSPSPDENLAIHPFFRMEFSLPADPSFETLIAARRLRATASLPSSPAPLPPQRPQRKSTRGRKKRALSKADLAGLVSADSDSSALTQESGEDFEDRRATAANDRRASMGTMTDGGTGGSEEDVDEEEAEAIPDTSTPPKMPSRRGRRGRGRGGSTMTRGRYKKRGRM